MIHRAALLNKCSCLVAASGVTKGRFVEQRLMLSTYFRCDQICEYERYDFGHFVVLLKSDLHVQQTHLNFLSVNAMTIDDREKLVTNSESLEF